MKMIISVVITDIVIFIETVFLLNSSSRYNYYNLKGILKNILINCVQFSLGIARLTPRELVLV